MPLRLPRGLPSSHALQGKCLSLIDVVRISWVCRDCRDQVVR
jgi:hypothetical protein